MSEPSTMTSDLNRPQSTPTRLPRSSFLSSPLSPGSKTSRATNYRPSRPPLESAKTVLSVEVFQRRHAEQFAHLHSDADAELLAMEKKRLEEERRLGREKRQSVSLGQPRLNSTRSASVDQTGQSWRRPLSLVQKHNAETAIAGKRTTMLGGAKSATVSSRPSSLQSDSIRSISLSSPASIARRQLRPASYSDTHHGQGLEILLEGELSSRGSLNSQRSPLHSSSEGDRSTSSAVRSTYSWATSFSGETMELRTAAQYVPAEQEPEPEVGAALDSPAKLFQRRKRIQAIAHTVRQLEGVGSREEEDPGFYDTLASAWYARFDDKSKALPPTLGSPANMPPTPYMPDGPLPPIVPGSIEEAGHADLRAYYARHNPVMSPTYMASPPDPDFRTPREGYEPSFIHHSHHSYPRPMSAAQSLALESVRYSYASSLHDLALDGGLEQGSRLMSAKAWLRPTSYVGTPWGGDFGDYTTPPPLRAPTPPEERHKPTNLQSPFAMAPPRTLRRINGNVSDYERSAQAPFHQEYPQLQAQGEAGPSSHGLGFANAWWGGTPDVGAAYSSPDGYPYATAPQHSHYHHVPDFRSGEDDTIPRTPHQVARQEVEKTTSSSRSSVVLEPIANTADVLLSSIFRRISRRHSHDHPHTPTAKKDQSIDPAGAEQLGRQRLRRTKSHPIGSLSSNPYLPIFKLTLWTTPLPLREIRDPTPSMSARIQPVEVSQSREDGLAGSQISSRRSRPMLHLAPARLPTPRPETPSTTSTMFPLAPLPSPIPSDEWRTRCSTPQEVHTPEEEIGVAVTTLQTVAMPLPSIPTRSSSRPRHSDSSSYRPGSASGSVRCPVPLEPPPPLPVHLSPARPHVESFAPGLSHTTAANDPRWSIRRNLHLEPPKLPPPLLYPPSSYDGPIDFTHSPPPSAPVSPAVYDLHSSGTAPQWPVPESTMMAVAEPVPRATRTAPKWLFFLGFCMPLLWLFGGWVGSTVQPHDAEMRNGTVEKAAVQLKAQSAASPWTRWALHPDPYVRRCRLGAAMVLPLCVIGGIVAAVLVTV